MVTELTPVWRNKQAEGTVSATGSMSALDVTKKHREGRVPESNGVERETGQREGVGWARIWVTGFVGQSRDSESISESPIEGWRPLRDNVILLPLGSEVGKQEARRPDGEQHWGVWPGKNWCWPCWVPAGTVELKLLLRYMLK